MDRAARQPRIQPPAVCFAQTPGSVRDASLGRLSSVSGGPRIETPPVSKEVRKLIRKMSRENPYGPKTGKISELRAYRWRASQVVDQAHADRVDARLIPLNREGQHQHEQVRRAPCR